MKHAVLAVALIVAALATPRAQSTITGRVVADDSGDRISNARVALNLPNNRDQERVVVVSDRDGRFSLPAPEGRHNVVATKTGFARGQATTVAGAGPVEIRLRRGAAISGRIIDEFGDPVVAARVFVEAPRTSAVVATTGTDDRGEYRIGGLSAGTFSVAVLTIGSSIRGRILFEPSLGSRAPNPWEVELSPIPVDYDLSPQSNFASADIRPNGSFAIESINGPRRLEVVAAPPGWVLKEIRDSGINVTDQILPFGTADESLGDVEVVLTDRVSELIGSVRDDRARPMAAATVIVFSTDRSHWYPRSRYVQRVRTEADGSFSIAGLAADTYYAVPVREVPADGADAWQEPAFLESLIPAAMNVLVAEGVKASANFRLSGR